MDDTFKKIHSSISKKEDAKNANKYRKRKVKFLKRRLKEIEAVKKIKLSLSAKALLNSEKGKRVTEKKVKKSIWYSLFVRKELNKWAKKNGLIIRGENRYQTSYFGGYWIIIKIKKISL